MAIELGKLTVGLLTESGITLRGLGGEALHALFFRILKQSSSELATNIHNNHKDQKPFSLSPPLSDYKLKNGYTVIPPGTTVNFKLAFLSEQLLTASVSAFLLTLQEKRVLRLSNKNVTLQNLDLCEGSFSSFSRTITNATSDHTIVLEFVTPTSFRKNEMQAIFPQPELVFSSLLKKWNTFSELKISEELAAYFPSIRVSSYNLRTELVPFSSYKIIGFRGQVEYELSHNAPEDFLQDVNALADFASYAGVGAKTTMGMGQIKRID